MSTSQQKKLVLYLDDDLDDLDFVRKSLQKYEGTIKLITFTNAFKLLEFINRYDKSNPLPCLIILDIHIPELNGKDVLKVLREINGYHDVPVILFTTSTLPADSRFAKNYNAELITKPLNSTQMDIIVRRFLTHCNEEIKNSFA
jgi:two-component system response regulator